MIHTAGYYALGDVNLNNTVTSIDSSKILRYVVQLESFTAAQLFLGDVDYDSQVLAADASAVLRYTVKLDVLPKYSVFNSSSGNGERLSTAIRIEQDDVSMRGKCIYRIIVDADEWRANSIQFRLFWNPAVLTLSSMQTEYNLYEYKISDTQDSLAFAAIDDYSAETELKGQALTLVFDINPASADARADFSLTDLFVEYEDAINRLISRDCYSVRIENNN